MIKFSQFCKSTKLCFLKIFATHTELELTGKVLRGVLERPKFSRLKFSKPDKNP